MYQALFRHLYTTDAAVVQVSGAASHDRSYSKQEVTRACASAARPLVSPGPVTGFREAPLHTRPPPEEALSP